jgi:hypothetical protein
MYTLPILPSHTDNYVYFFPLLKEEEMKSSSDFAQSLDSERVCTLQRGERQSERGKIHLRNIF